MCILSAQPAIGGTDPLITQNPMNTAVELFQSVNLTCDAVGRPMPMYMWLKNGEIIEGATLSYLFIDRVNISDRGLYTCVANNSLNSATSFDSIVHIEGKQQPEKWVSWYACFVVSVVVCPMYECFYILTWT